MAGTLHKMMMNIKPRFPCSYFYLSEDGVIQQDHQSRFPTLLIRLSNRERERKTYGTRMLKYIFRNLIFACLLCVFKEV